MGVLNQWDILNSNQENAGWAETIMNPLARSRKYADGRQIAKGSGLASWMSESRLE